MTKKELLKILKAIANDARLDILMLLTTPKESFLTSKFDPETQGVCLGLIAEKLGYSQSTISSYMTKLEHVGLVESNRHGQWTLYRLSSKRVKELILALKQFFGK
jgi:ArsR family transcriptional regulator